MDRKTPIAVALVLAASAVAFLALRGQESRRAERKPSESAHPAPPAERPARAARESRTGLQPGHVLTYRVRSESKVVIGPPQERVASQQAVESGFAVRGTVTLHAYDRLQSGSLLGFEIEEVRADVFGRHPEPVEAGRRFADSLKGEVLAELRPGGSFGSVLFPPEMPDPARVCWKGLLKSLELTHSDDPEASSWEAVEEDATGTFVARYRKASEGDAGTVIEKTIVEYRSFKIRGHAGRGSVRKAGGTTRYVLDPLPVLIEGSSWLVASLAGREITAHAELDWSRLTVRRLELAASARERRERFRSESATKLADPIAEAEIDPTKAAEALRRIRGKLTELESRGLAKSLEYKRLLTDLVRLLRRAPNLTEEVVDEIEGASRERTAVLVAALGAANTEAGQDALRALFSDRDRPVDLRKQALRSLIQVLEPVPSLDEAILRHGKEGPEFYSGSLLAISAIAHRIRNSDTERYERIRKHVELELDAAQTSEQLRVVLLAVENLGPPEIHGRVRKALESEEAFIRAAAVRSLVRVPSDEVFAIARAFAIGDPAEEVRAAAIDMLVQRHATKSGVVRRDRLEKLLREVASADKSDNLKKHATLLLEKLG
ncbi:MAG: HEAT repeat domain-containing protein [Planctomycetota bacterium]|jgi:hypothetical protein